MVPRAWFKLPIHPRLSLKYLFGSTIVFDLFDLISTLLDILGLDILGLQRRRYIANHARRSHSKTYRVSPVIVAY